MAKRGDRYGKLMQIRIGWGEYRAAKALVGVLAPQSRLPGGITLSSYVSSCVKRCLPIDCAKAGIEPPRFATNDPAIRSDIPEENSDSVQDS